MTSFMEEDDDCQLPSETASLSSIEMESDYELEPENPAQEQVTEGSECTIQTLYEGPPKCNCRINWVQEYAEDLRKAVEDEPETKPKALVVRMAKSHEEGKLLVMDSILVQSPTLKKTLGEVFEGYKGITASLKKLVFKAPFHEFYYRWGRLSEILERQVCEDPTAAAYTQLLYDVLDAELVDFRLEIMDLLFHRVITFPYLWAVFEPRSHIVKKFDGYEQFYVVQNCQYHHGVLYVNAALIEWDGTRFGYERVTHQIKAFSGTQAIEDLEVFPASFHPFRKDAEAKAIARGELGRYADDVEDRLNTVLELAEKWNAVLLFDECDVFMQQRSTGQLEHNEIVSVFLRILEYYRGILFMTSNRADMIDQAFYSRIHLTLHYPDLDQDARGHIWEQFM